MIAAGADVEASLQSSSAIHKAYIYTIQLVTTCLEATPPLLAMHPLCDQSFGMAARPFSPGDLNSE